MPTKIDRLFSEIDNVPQISKVIRILINQLSDPNVDLKETAKNVGKDQIISLKVLRLVNSASFGLSKKVSSIEEAVVLLGMTKLKTLVIASGIVSALPKIDNFDLKQFWLENFSTACYARWIANASGCNADIAFTAGLLNSLGTLLIHLGLPTEALEIEHHLKEGHSRPFLEKTRLNFTSQDVSAELCRRWKFSNDLILPVAQSIDPLATNPASKIACSVHIARQISLCTSANMSKEDTLMLLSPLVINHLEFPNLFFEEKIGDIMELNPGLDSLLD